VTGPEQLSHHRPGSLDEAAALAADLAAMGRAFVYLGGGSDLIPALKLHRDQRPALISLSRIEPLRGIERMPDGGTRIGALTSLARIAEDATLRRLVPALSAAAASVASPQIRNQATLGGNLLVDRRCVYYNQSEVNRTAHGPCFKAGGEHCPLIKSVQAGDWPQCHARFVSDTAPVLLLMNAVVHLAGPHGERSLALTELYRPDGIEGLAIAADEILTRIEIPPQPGGKVHYQKLAVRKTLDFPSVGVAVSLSRTGNTSRLGVAVTGVNTYPGCFGFDRDDHDDFDAMVDSACETASGFAEIYRQDFFPLGWRRDMIAVLIRRGVAALRAGQSQTGPSPS